MQDEPKETRGKLTEETKKLIGAWTKEELEDFAEYIYKKSIKRRNLKCLLDVR